jgi:carboxypeptidase D
MHPLYLMIVQLLIFFSLFNHGVICLQASDFYVRDLPLLPKEASSIRMYAGHLPVNPEHYGALFFWYFARKNVADKSRTVIWLNGGPGCSSLVGAWMEIGPFRFQDNNTMVENNGSWHLFTNLLFVDQPVGTGFSYIDTDSFTHELDEMANQFLGFLDRYIEIFPELLQNDIYLAGQSFAGQHIPYVAQAIL